MNLKAIFLLLPVAVCACEPPTTLTIYYHPYNWLPVTDVRLRWSPSNCSTYHIWRSSELNGNYAVIAETSDTTVLINVDSTMRFFYVTASDLDSVDSSPSNVTAYFKFTTVAHSAYTAFGLPFRFWNAPSGGIPTYGVSSTDPEDILGHQLMCGSVVVADKVVRQDNSELAWIYYNACDWWYGSLQWNHSMKPGRAYWIQNKTASNRDIVLAGEVDNSGHYDTLTVLEGSSAYTALSWRNSMTLNRDHLNLVANGFRGGTMSSSDQVLLQNGGRFMWQRASDNTWQGSLTTIEPGKAYWILNRPHDNGVWNYTYDASGNP